MAYKEVILTASDPKYFCRFAVPLVVSAIDTEMPLHLGICNPDERSYAVLGFIADYVLHHKAENLITWGIEEAELDPAWDKGVWAQCGRIRHALKYWENPENADHKLYLLDVDSIIRRKFAFPEAPIALCIDPLRDRNGRVALYDDVWKDVSSRILMSGFFSSATAPLLEAVLSYCEDLEYRKWGTDQYALNEVLSTEDFVGLWPMIYNYFGTNILKWSDWDGGAVWTGKWNKINADEPYRQVAITNYRRFLRDVLAHNEDLKLFGLSVLFEHQ